MADLTCRALPFLAVAVVLASGGCASTDAAPADLYGTWEWMDTSGGIAGETRTAGPGDPRITVELKADGTAVFRRNGVEARTQRFRVVSEMSIYHGTEMPVLYYDEEDLGRVVQVFDGGTILTLSDNVYDGFSLRYRRVDSLGVGDSR